MKRRGTSSEPASATSSQPAANVAEKPKLTLVKDFSGRKIGVLHYVAISIWLGWFIFYVTLPGVLYVLYHRSFATFTVLIGLLVTSALYPIKWKLQPKWGFAMGRRIVQLSAEYFQLRVFAEDYDAIMQAKPAIFGLEPHDVLPVSIIALGDHLDTLPGHKLRGGLTSACFSVPGMRHIYTWATAVSVDKKSLRNLLSHGYSVAVCPGGAHEVTYMTSPSDPETVLYLRKRLGLPRIASEFKEGMHIVPCFCFNQRPTFDFFVPNYKWLHRLGRAVGFIPLVFSGIFGIPFAPPKPVPLNFVMCKPIFVPHLTPDDPKRDEVLQSVQLQFVQALERVFDAHVAELDPRHARALQRGEEPPRLRIV